MSERQPAGASTALRTTSLLDQRAAVDSIPTCRICYGPDEEAEEGPAGSLLAPCKCSGTVRYVHCGCLRKWRRLRSQQRGFYTSQRCEMCHGRYRIPTLCDEFFDKELMGGLLPGPRHCWDFLAAKFSTPYQAADFALDLWCHAVVLTGMARGAHLGQLSFRRTLAIGFAIVQKNSQGLAAHNRLPVRTVGSLALSLGSFAYLCALSAEVLVLSGLSAYFGAICGFGLGSTGVIVQTFHMGRRLLALGALRILGLGRVTGAVRRLLAPR